jgi:hypothetical protein
LLLFFSTSKVFCCSRIQDTYFFLVTILWFSNKSFLELCRLLRGINCSL